MIYPGHGIKDFAIKIFFHELGPLTYFVPVLNFKISCQSDVVGEPLMAF